MRGRARAGLDVAAAVLLLLAGGVSWWQGQPSAPVVCIAPWGASPTPPLDGPAPSWFCGQSAPPRDTGAPAVLAVAGALLALAAVASGPHKPEVRGGG